MRDTLVLASIKSYNIRTNATHDLLRERKVKAGKEKGVRKDKKTSLYSLLKVKRVCVEEKKPPPPPPTAENKVGGAGDRGPGYSQPDWDTICRKQW